MFDIGWSEMTVVVVIALLVLGPKQLPEALKTITQFTRKARRYAQDFRSGIDNIVREAELEEARDALKSVKSVNPSKALSDLVDPTGEVDKEMKDLEDTTKKQTDPSIEAKPSSVVAETKADEEAEGGSEEKPEGAKIVKAPEAIAPGNSIRPPAGPDIFAATPPREEAAAAEPPKAEPEVEEASTVAESSELAKGAKEDERRQV